MKVVKVEDLEKYFSEMEAQLGQAALVIGMAAAQSQGTIDEHVSAGAAVSRLGVTRTVLGDIKEGIADMIIEVADPSEES